MKSGWQTKRLQEVVDSSCSLSYGIVQPGEDVQEGLPIVRPVDLTNKFITLSGLKCINPILAESYKRTTLSGNEILMCVRGNTGVVSIASQELKGANVTRGIVPIRFDSRKINYLFGFYVLCSDYVQRQIKAKTYGAALMQVNISDLKNIEINFPDNEKEQRRIVAILDEAFAGISAAKESAEKNLKNAKEVFESYLESVISFGKHGEGWKEMTLKEISSSFGRGRSKHRPRNDQTLYGGEYPFIQTGDIRNANHIITDYSQTYNETGLAQSKLWPKGTICITIAANIAETAILNFDACFPDSVIGIVVNQKKADSDYVEFLLQAFKARIQSMSKGSAQENINLGTFENELFPFPPVDTQKNIVKSLSIIHQETRRLESIYQQKMAILEELKKSILHKAFSGAL